MQLSNNVAKLDALEKMRKALSQLEHLQEEQIIRNKAVVLFFKSILEPVIFI